MTEPEYILVCAAWPYGSADIHQGNVTGSYLPADIYARYHRLRGNHVLMISGTDSHGTPVTVKAEEEGKHPRSVFERYHKRFLKTMKDLGLSYNLFTHTDTENHERVAQDIFLRLLENGYLYRKVMAQMYSPLTQKFLPDRYVEGTCPNCDFNRARGDQCDNCNTLFQSASELLNPRSKMDDSALELRDTEHYFIDLAALSEDGLKDWIQKDKEHWRAHVLNFARHWILEEGLHGRAISRDMNWGVSLPVDDPTMDGKVLYVWFEAVIGYLSAAIEWSKNNDQPDSWKKWWYGENARTVYFIGKDNIPFHAVMWPAQLLGVQRIYETDESKRLNLPYDVPANQFMNMEGMKISGSMKWGVWMHEALERHDPDPLRYYLTVVMPETRDSDWSWEGYVERNNSELVANWGNLVNRVLNMTKQYFGRVIPEPGQLDAASSALLTAVDEGFTVVGELYDRCDFRAAVREVLRLSTLVNQYLEEQSPWTTAKQDLTVTGQTLYTALQAIGAINILFAPVLPFSSEKLQKLLGEEGALFGQQEIVTYHESKRKHKALIYHEETVVSRWERPLIPAGRKLPKPKPLFKKLGPEVAEQELGLLGQRPAG